MTNYGSEEIKSNRRRRENSSAEKILIDFIAVCSVSTRYDLKDVASSIRTSSENANSDDYSLFDMESFSSLNLKFEKPKIIKYEPLSHEIISKRIGKSYSNWDAFDFIFDSKLTFQTILFLLSLRKSKQLN